MNDITRYEYDEGDGNWRFPGFVECYDGRWVEYADHVAIVEDLKRQVKAAYEGGYKDGESSGAADITVAMENSYNSGWEDAKGLFGRIDE